MSYLRMYPYVSEIWGWNESVQQSFFDDFISNAYRNMSIIMDGDRRIGMMNWHITEAFFELENICIVPEYQGKGIGSAVLEELLETCGYSVIKLQVFKKNPAIDLYRRLGFTVTGESEYHYQMELKRG